MSSRAKDATEATAGATRDAVAHDNMEDQSDFFDTERGFIADIPHRKIAHEDGSLRFDLSALDYIEDDSLAPTSVNPSLWRQSKPPRRAGLFKLTDGLYQVRNNDLATLTIVAPRAAWW